MKKTIALLALSFMKRAVFLSIGVPLIFAQSVQAATVTIDFDSLPALPLLNGGVVAFTGPALDNYLAGFGVTTSNLSPGSFMYVANLTGANNIVVPSSPNVFSQTSGSQAQGSSFTLNFSNSVDNFSFTRAGYVAAFSPNGTVLGDWSATAFNASNVALGTIGEGLIATFGDIPLQTFTLADSGISYINFSANAHGFAGQEMPFMDNMSFDTTVAAPVPEPETYALLLAGLGVLGFAVRRRQRKSVQA